MNNTQEEKHRKILERYPAEEQCACDPTYGRWCAFHADFESNVSERSRELLRTLAAQALALHEMIQDYLVYSHKVNHQKVKGALGRVEASIELYQKGRERDIEAEKERRRQASTF